jgi:hypothetical protein
LLFFRLTMDDEATSANGEDESLALDWLAEHG